MFARRVEKSQLAAQPVDLPGYQAVLSDDGALGGMHESNDFRLSYPAGFIHSALKIGIFQAELANDKGKLPILEGQSCRVRAAQKGDIKFRRSRQACVL